MTPLFKATARFDPSDGDRWKNYFEWAKIPALCEVVSLDGILCPVLGHDLTDEDWNHNVQADFRLHYFYHLDYLLDRTFAYVRRNILGLYRNPDAHIETPPAAGFVFVGYDLIEESTQISAVCNCGGFPESFSNDELNRYGLLDDFNRACIVKHSLATLNPDEHHAQCEMYAIWRLSENQA